MKFTVEKRPKNIGRRGRGIATGLMPQLLETVGKRTWLRIPLKESSGLSAYYQYVRSHGVRLRTHRNGKTIFAWCEKFAGAKPALAKKKKG